ncbi:putative sugar nucleotidyl transferase [Sphingobacterium yanglingense]|uniref:UDP-N-acetylglucosamine diphosphorylase/glucosamine-1-phosphate N-acetyltransferase n=1 Tax=Sphingobacterium yanglingense TaxID=1437280 RepID=A0A4R6WMN1_9SPHI|nr:putative sugar nucleotidyl transferase [Sphingobacterium yanglingense]TDQ80297.1 UDP-N-acetylglucosamine diphosphorylase/glucosamine-1-phosphate N-acetyltransferase [Sphingobacterium yanglingense]
MSFSILLFDDCSSRERLMPLTSTRPTGNLRVGIFTLDEKWRQIFNVEVSYLTTGYLREKFPASVCADKDVLLIDGAILPNTELVYELGMLEVGQKLVSATGDWIAVRLSTLDHFEGRVLDEALTVVSAYEHRRLEYPEDIYRHNAEQIVFDLPYVGGSVSSPLNYSSCSFVGSEFYIAESAIVGACVLDSSKGPIHVGAGAVLEAGVVVYGPVSIGSGCRVKSGTVLYPNVSIGPFSTVCGEVNNTVIWGNSAKGHLGYLGCAVLGEGCNIGAGSSNSNLRNDWKNVRLYDYSTGKMRDTGMQKCGVIMGDQVMLGINSKINTGTVIGVGCQIAISNFIPKFVEDFSWLTDEAKSSYIFEEFLAMMRRKSVLKQEQYKEEDERIFSFIYKRGLTYNEN